MIEKSNGALATPRPALPVNWTNDPAFRYFNDYDRAYACQIEQQLAALGQEKALILLNFLADNPPYGVR